MYLGVDVGSVTTNAVLIDDNKKISGWGIVNSGFNHTQAINRCIHSACDNAGIDFENIKNIVGTGYGRRNVQGACKVITEISCHAKGIFYINKSIRTLIDIGGQDSKVIRISDDGLVENFLMNDKCAAGTGRFLEVMSHTIGININELGPLSMQASNPTKISSTCTVFAESEVISRISEGISSQDIVAGIHNAIGERIIGLAYSLGVEPQIALTGGVAKNDGLVYALKNIINQNIYIPKEPQIVGALGAALYAYEYVQISI